VVSNLFTDGQADSPVVAVAYSDIEICREIVLKYKKNEDQKFVIPCQGFAKR
jgi:hypothetical protein